MNRIPRPKIVVAIVAAVVLAVGLGVTGTVAASRSVTADDERRAVLDDAADRLDVEPSELEDALRDALKARVDTAVEEGRLTEEQGVELKTRIDSGEMQFLRGLGKPGPGRFGHFHHFARFPALRAAAEYLGLAEEELRERLRDGDTLAEVAKAEGKAVDGLVDALVADAEKRLDDAVAAGKLTPAQADELADRLYHRMTDLVNGELPGPGFGHRHRFDGHEHPLERRGRNA
ncbi:MAG TPA: hypothetical protein VFB57_06790 [Gaiellaceae bacterium]|nr:hypothetical protein [Gaiellaceae bacterium]